MIVYKVINYDSSIALFIIDEKRKEMERDFVFGADCFLCVEADSYVNWR